MIKKLRIEGWIAVWLALGIGGAPVASADDAPKLKFDIHGIVGASMYVQTNPDFLLNGQGPLLMLSQNNGGGVTTGFDARQSRLNFSVTGPEVRLFGAATPKAVVEEDFFGLNSVGGYGEVSVLQRLRLAYAELNWGDTQVRFGQDWELLWNGGPVSLGHIAYPPTYFAGLSGWREPGIGIYHKFVTGEESSVQVAAQLLKSDWENPLAATASSTLANVLNVDAGQLSGWPGIELRVKWAQSKTDENMAYVAAHWNRVAGSAVGSAYNNGAPLNGYSNRDWDVAEAKIGARWKAADFALSIDAYAGQNVAPLVGEQAVFSLTANDVHEVGGWAQAGYYFTPALSLWAVAGTSRSSIDDVTAAGGGRWANTVAGGMLQWKEGGFGIGPELYWVETRSTKPSGAAAPDGVMSGAQLMFSGMYFF